MRDIFTVDGKTMNDLISAIGNTLRLVGGALVFILIALPLGILCYVIAVLLLPIDALLMILSGKKSNWAIFKGFSKAGQTLFGWFSDFAS
ncbi:hypothetical protein [Candidatus Thiosymbion oneisti]|uniref:hypothetical protein n=1 Tax=Candidatus Thiosymbion oneisti TaxID=589554 RepID=UPI00114CF774|nr:hypothetical protein [Candidatus Thiosymbion oneisti]